MTLFNLPANVECVSKLTAGDHTVAAMHCCLQVLVSSMALTAVDVAQCWLTARTVIAFAHHRPNTGGAGRHNASEEKLVGLMRERVCAIWGECVCVSECE